MAKHRDAGAAALARCLRVYSLQRPSLLGCQRTVLAAMLSLFALFNSGPVQAQEVKTSAEALTIQLDGSETADQIKTIVEGVSNGTRPVVIRMAKPADVPLSTVPGTDSENILLQNLERGTLEGVNDLRAVPSLFTGLSAWWGSSPPVLWSLPKLAGAIVAALLAAGLARAAVSRIMKADTASPALDATLAERLGRSLSSTAGAAAALAAGGVAASLLVRVISAAGTSERELLSLVIEFVVSVCIFLLVGWFVLAPREPSRRLLWIPNAERHWAFLCGFAFLNPLFIFLAKLANAPQQGGPGVGGLILAFTTITTLYKVWWFWLGRRDIATLIQSGGSQPEQPGALRKALASTAPLLLILSAILVWLIGRIANVYPDGYNWAYAASFTQFVIVLAPIFAVGVSQLAREKLLKPEDAGAPLQSAIRSLAVKLSGGAAWLLSLFILGWTWRFFVEDSDAFARWAGQLVGILSIAVIGWIVVNFLRSLFRALEPDRSEPVEGAPPVASWRMRLATVLPIFRGLAVGLVIGLTALLILTKLGVDISPLLAGFGIFGLAVSFGSQTLVKDIVAGFFFMVEDAFRTGEYIDTGKQKGTVEKISLRSVQLRHQSGVLHTIPFGQLGSVTNASRDWSTIKFMIRLDRSTDIEQARKIIKKVGLALKEDPEWSSAILMPPKMQGVDEIADAAVVIRIKFTALPPQAGALQREALKRIYLALTEAGIEFATNAVMVRSDRITEADEAAAASKITKLPLAQPA